MDPTDIRERRERCSEHGLAVGPEGGCVLCRRARAGAAWGMAARVGVAGFSVVAVVVLAAHHRPSHEHQVVATRDAVPPAPELRAEPIAEQHTEPRRRVGGAYVGPQADPAPNVEQPAGAGDLDPAPIVGTRDDGDTPAAADAPPDVVGQAPTLEVVGYSTWRAPAAPGSAGVVLYDAVSPLARPAPARAVDGSFSHTRHGRHRR